MNLRGKRGWAHRTAPQLPSFQRFSFHGWYLASRSWPISLRLITPRQFSPMSGTPRPEPKAGLRPPSLITERSADKCINIRLYESTHHRWLPMRSRALSVRGGANRDAEMPLSRLPAGEWRASRLRDTNASERFYFYQGKAQVSLRLKRGRRSTSERILRGMRLSPYWRRRSSWDQ